MSICFKIDTTGVKLVLCIPDQLRKEISGYTHSGECGHYGVTKTVKYIQNFCVLRNMYRTVAKVIGLCLICAKTKAPNRKFKGMMGHVLTTEPLEIVCIDLFSPLPKGRGMKMWRGWGVEYIFVILDMFTKFMKLSNQEGYSLSNH
ncbi:hypothetical protein PR048_010695 [Dryococelus australis]|uniref:Integrase zinc-binding domain-containing protein n=1 Tax=Dryococelus australis TaxID=614101 RepID=A0ABQ9I3E3_9NEOP|nr:hypothetical protein PR048_010695 [Dryococelus australis]